MCSRSQLNVSDKNKNIANLWQTANSIHIQLPMHAQPFTKLQNRSQWFLRIKPIDMSCRKMKTHAKLVTADKTTHAEFHKSKFRPVRNRPKLWNSKTSQNCYSTPISAWQLFHHSFLHFSSQLSAASKPSTTTWLGITTKKPIHWEGTCPLRRSCERPRQTCTTSCHSRRIPKPS